MVRDAMRGYWHLASGLTEVTAARARDAVRSVLPMPEGGPSAAWTRQAQAMAEELLNVARGNREHLTGLVRAEVERAAAGLGFVREEDVRRLEDRVRRLEEANRVAARPATRAPATSRGTASGPEPSPAARAVRTRRAATATSSAVPTPSNGGTAGTASRAVKRGSPRKSSAADPPTPRSGRAAKTPRGGAT